MDSSPVNVLISTFAGLSTSKTITIQTTRNAPISTVLDEIYTRLPPESSKNLRITTNSNRNVDSRCNQPISTLLSSQSEDFINLRLSVPLCGGKGGFGSQLRAQGGRMSSRKKRNQGDPNASSRNLDGRRLRTITEAKALAEYLAVKPEMDKKEKEERLKRWEQVVEIAEKKQEELKSGGKARLDGKWMEAKEDAEEKMREAIKAALEAGEIKDLLEDSEMSEDGSEGTESSGEKEEKEEKKVDGAEPSNPAARSFYGWEEDEEVSDSEDEEVAESSKVKS
jgi:Silencing defective 2 N-terminal ubiquitin domain